MKTRGGPRRSIPRAGLLTFLLAGLVSVPAIAQTDAHCEKVRARALADAALLFAPSVGVQGIQFPSVGSADPTLNTYGSGFQARAALSLSAVDIYRGTQLLKSADLECAREEAADQLTHFLELGADYGRVRALREASAVLERRASEMNSLVSTVQSRFDERVINQAQWLEVRRAHARNQEKLLELKGELGRIEAHCTEPVGGIDTLIAVTESRSMELEQQLAHLRSLDAWKVEVSGGVVATQPTDYFGSVQLAWNVGGLFRKSSEDTYLRARAAELRTSRGELVRAAGVLKERLQATRQEVDGRLALAKTNLTEVQQLRTSALGSDSGTAAQTATLLFFEQVSLESEVAYLEAWAEELRKL